MKNYKIVPIAEEYIEELCEAVGSVARERKYLAFLDTPPLEVIRAAVLKNIEGDWPHFVAISEEKVVGWCDIVSLRRPVFAHSGGLGMGVLVSYRGQGIGQALIRAAIDKAKSKGITRIELMVREHNEAAIALYKKLGFQEEGFHCNAVRIDDEYHNLISMVLLF